MSDEYLWDKTGRDEEIERLERALSPYAFDARRAAPPPPVRHPGRLILAVAAPLAAAALLLVLLVPRTEPLPPASPAPPADLLAAGEWMHCATDRREIDVDGQGRVVVDPGTRVKILVRRPDLFKLRLEEGSILAIISTDARPRYFQVETPAATCVDLGCKYTLAVDEGGRTTVRVVTGRVGLADGTREVYVRMGATGRAIPGRGAGLPWMDDAPEALRKAIDAFDARPPGSRAAEAKAVCDAATRERDSLTVWNFLQDPEEEVALHGALWLQKHFGTPPGVEPLRGCRKLTAVEIERWKKHLGYW